MSHLSAVGSGCMSRPHCVSQRRRAPTSTRDTVVVGVSATPVELSHSRCDHLLIGYRREMARTAGSYAAHSEMLRTEEGRRKGTDSAQRNKPLDGFRGEAPIISKFANVRLFENNRESTFYPASPQQSCAERNAERNTVMFVRLSVRLVSVWYCYNDWIHIWHACSHTVSVVVDAAVQLESPHFKSHSSSL